MTRRYRKPHRYKKKKPFYRYGVFWFLILALVFLSALFYFLFLADFFQVKSIDFSGLEEIPESDLSSLIYQKLENRILFFSSKSIFLANLGRIESSILERFPQIARAEISRRFPDKLDVLILKRKISAVFCPEERQECFTVDKEGIVYQEADFLDSISRPIIKSSSDEEINLGDRVVEKADLAKIMEINAYLEKDLSIGVKEFAVSPHRLAVLTRQGWHIYFSLQEDVKWQLMKLKALLGEKVPEEKRGELEYIELRFGNFANPKYRNQSM